MLFLMMTHDRLKYIHIYLDRSINKGQTNIWHNFEIKMLMEKDNV